MSIYPEYLLRLEVRDRNDALIAVRELSIWAGRAKDEKYLKYLRRKHLKWAESLEGFSSAEIIEVHEPRYPERDKFYEVEKYA